MTNPTTDPTGDDESSGSSGGTGILPDDEGCGCAADTNEGKTRGLLGTLLTFGLAGFMRRRRRAS